MRRSSRCRVQRTNLPPRTALRPPAAPTSQTLLPPRASAPSVGSSLLAHGPQAPVDFKRLVTRAARVICTSSRVAWGGPVGAAAGLLQERPGASSAAGSRLRKALGQLAAQLNRPALSSAFCPTPGAVEEQAQGRPERFRRTLLVGWPRAGPGLCGHNATDGPPAAEQNQASWRATKPTGSPSRRRGSIGGYVRARRPAAALGRPSHWRRVKLAPRKPTPWQQSSRPAAICPAATSVTRHECPARPAESWGCVTTPQCCPRPPIPRQRRQPLFCWGWIKPGGACAASARALGGLKGLLHPKAPTTRQVAHLDALELGRLP